MEFLTYLIHLELHFYKNMNATIVQRTKIQKKAVRKTYST